MFEAIDCFALQAVRAVMEFFEVLLGWSLDEDERQVAKFWNAKNDEVKTCWTS